MAKEMRSNYIVKQYATRINIKVSKGDSPKRKCGTKYLLIYPFEVRAQMPHTTYILASVWMYGVCVYVLDRLIWRCYVFSNNKKNMDMYKTIRFFYESWITIFVIANATFD